MGSSADSRYYTCPKCMRVYDWETEAKKIKNHRCKTKRLDRESLKGLRASLGYSRIGRGNV
jgi:hypothetical protein